jgi:uncharacterized SAM-binding protein YcdF (DUF218 family)
MKNRLVIILPVIALACLIYLLTAFLGEAEGYGAVAKGPDAIVVLTGGKGRVEQGLEFLREGVSPTLILSGVNEAADLDSIFAGGLDGVDRDRIILEKQSKSTYENALQVKRLVIDRGYSSVLLITSSYHMKRAFFIFNRVMPEGVLIMPYRVSSPNFNEERWWDWKGLSILTPEFIKYSWYEIRFGLESVIAEKEGAV